MNRLGFVSLLCLLSACASASNGPSATATVEPRSGSSVNGTVEFTQLPDGVQVRIGLSGLTPGPHGFHIHEKGDCSAADATSAGPHFNPTSQPHGAPDAAAHHMGDFGNLVADDKGEVHQKSVVSWISLEGDNTIVGRAVVVHKDPDDLTSQPAGNAGSRIGCGVITMAGAVH